jgi:OOP family OmpA-OmpF porin
VDNYTAKETYLMWNRFSQKILIGIVTGTLWSMAMVPSLAAADDSNTYFLLNSEGNPVRTTREGECVLTPKTPNTPAKSFRECGSIGDRDNDGIPDDEDICPDNTPEEISKGVYQEGPKKGCPIDTDNDGVPDYRDDCPNNTPLEISKGVDERGCPLDSDGDGVPDYRDKCPGTPRDLAVDEDGCPILDPEGQPDLVLVAEGDVLFDFDKYNLRSDGQRLLEEMLGKIDLSRTGNIKVVGHTDPVGTNSYNMRLSIRRATTVAKYLKSRIREKEIQAEGRGELELVTREPGEPKKVWHQRCRRVEVKIWEYQKRSQ